jgi:hypothetical protein
MFNTSSAFDFRRPVSYDATAKRAFHSRARHQLKKLAAALGLAAGAPTIFAPIKAASPSRAK